MERNLELTITHILKATAPEQIFGLILDQDQLADAYKRLARIVHPDVVPAAHKDQATEAFTVLNTRRGEAHYKLSQRTYGDLSAPTVPKAPPPPSVIETKTRRYAITKQVAEGDLADLYLATYDAPVRSASVPPDTKVLLKVAGSAKDNDLLDNEVSVLQALRPKDAPEEKFLRYVPYVDDTFLLGKSRRRVIVLPYYNEHWSVLEVYKQKDALDWRDAVWVYKRTLEGLGYAHQQGYVHGAIIPPHVLVHPVNHGARLIDWCYAVKFGAGARLKAYSKAWSVFSAPEVFDKRPVTPQADIYSAAKLFVFMVGGSLVSNTMPPKVPAEVQRFMASCLYPAPSRRPDDAWKLRDEFGQLLETIIGKPKYRRLDLPAR